MSTLELTSKIEQARRTTTIVADVIEHLRFGLDRPVPCTDDFGVFASPADVHALLLDARTRIQGALDAMHATAWPRKSDYQEAADGHD